MFSYLLMPESDESCDVCKEDCREEALDGRRVLLLVVCVESGVHSDVASGEIAVNVVDNSLCVGRGVNSEVQVDLLHLLLV